MKFLKSHFAFNRSQRNGILFLLGIIILLQISIFSFNFTDFNENAFVKNDKSAAIQKEIDSLKNVQIENSSFKIYPFNPNYLTDFKGYQLGMSENEIDRLLQFRSEGNFINSIKEFQDVTKVNDSLLNIISPYFKFPEWVKTTKNTASKSKKNSVVIEVKDLNTATVEDLVVVNGVGSGFANRIISYRKKLQGYSFNEQLEEVYGVDKSLADKILTHFQIKTSPKIQKINVNTATFKEVLNIVYIDYELTKKIFNYRDEVAEIQSLDELKKIDGFPLDKFNRIALYLLAE